MQIENENVLKAKIIKKKKVIHIELFSYGLV